MLMVSRVVMGKKELEKSYRGDRWESCLQGPGAGVDRKVAMAVKEKTAEFCPHASGWWTGLWGMISLAAAPKLFREHW